MLENMEWKSKLCSIVLCIGIASHLFLHAQCAHNIKFKGMPTNPGTRSPGAGSAPVKLTTTNQQVVLDNGIVSLTFSNPGGALNVMNYRGGLDNLLEPIKYIEGRRGNWDIVYSRSANVVGKMDTLEGTVFKVIDQNDDKVEISFSKTWNPSTESAGLPLNYDRRYIMLRGSSGFYSYGIFEHLKGWPEIHMEEARIAFKLNQNLFDYMAVSDNIQRIMPSEADFNTGTQLGYKEAKLLVNPSNPTFKGQVEDKYQYSMDAKDSFVHGWISSEGTGFWVITPSDEFRCGGPTKYELTSHAGPTALAIFFSGHYAGEDLRVHIANGEPWKKVFGPVFFYLNSNGDKKTLWNDAKRKMGEEKRKWPYDFPLSPDFIHAAQRGSVFGHLMVHDGNTNAPANFGYVGLARPGEPGSWQVDSKGYQFWVLTNKYGRFNIRNILPGTYNVYAWVPGVIGDYKSTQNIEIKGGSNINLGDLAFYPPRSGPTVWEIGIPDRTAKEFFIPDPPPGLSNSLFNGHPEKWRQYGLWDRYTDLYPKGDLTYNVGSSDYKKDWFFAQVTRKVGDKYVPTTWQIKFPIANANGAYTFRIALASETYAQLQVRVNDPGTPRPLFQSQSNNSGRRDNAIARHGIHGTYWLYQVDIPAGTFINGINTIYLTQKIGGSPFNGVMYDYLRLEGPIK